MVTLSVFEVDATQDTGYGAQNTLSGTRLNTNVQDIGGTMTVITPQLWEDFALEGTNDMLRFTPGAEKNDVQQADGAGQALFFGDNTRIRGIQFENIVRNGFRTNMPSDTYNASRFEFQRGPNAILFGTTGAGGGAAGMVNRTTKDAIFRDGGRYQLRLDEFGSVRHIVDYNKVLVPGKLALYGAVLSDDKENWIKPTYQNQDRYYAALHYRPVENLSVKVRYEDMKWLRTAAEPGMHYDGISPVLGAAELANTTPAGLAVTSSSSVQPRYAPQGTLPTYLLNNGYRTQPTTSVVFGGADGAASLENWRYKVLGANVIVIGTSNVSLPQGVVPLDFNQFGEASTQYFDGHNVQANLQYQLNRKIDLEYAYNYEFMVYEFISGGGNRLQVDMAKTLQDGVTPNPNAGRYVLDMFPGFTLFQDRYNSNHRVTASFNHDFRDGDKFRWLGKHTLVGMFEKQNQTHFWDQKRLLNTTPLPGYSTNLWDGTQQNAVRFVNYVDPATGTFSGETNSRKFQAEANKVAGVNAQWLPVIGSGQAFDETTDSLLAVWQGRFWDDRVIATTGIRRDAFSRYSGEEYQDPNQPVGVAIPSRDITMVEDAGQSALAPTTKNYGIVYHAVRNKGVLDYLSPYYNYSDSFGSGVFNNLVDGSKGPNATGDTSDYGLKFGLLDGRISGVFSLFKASNYDIPEERSINFAELSDLFEYLDPVKYASYVDVSNVRETRDLVSKGWEFQLTANLTKNWRMGISVDHFKTELSHIAPLTGQLIEEYRNQWLANPNDLIPGGNRTVQDVFTTMEFSYLRAIAQEGSVTANERANRFTLLTNYTFDSGRLKNVGVGLNAAWQDKPATGFALQNIGGNWVPDPDNVFFGYTILRVGANVSYKRKIWDDKINWRVQLNVSDIGNVDPYPVRQSATAAAPTTPVTTYWHRGFPQTVTLTNTFEF